MNCIIPFTKDVEFNTNIGEIASISLEHDYTLNDYELLGNFNIFGEYKIHEVSVNKDKFSYVVPFSVTLPNKVIKDTLEFGIEDFTYEVVDNKYLRVNIEYSIKADEEKEEEILFQKVEDVEPIEELMDNKEERISIEEQKDIIDTSKDTDNTFVTYHIHILKDSETIDTVCTKYKTNQDILSEYNDISNITDGDKIIIPDNNE